MKSRLGLITGICVLLAVGVWAWWAGRAEEGQLVHIIQNGNLV